MISSEDTQPMEVTITYTYDADVFDGEKDMVRLAKEEQDYLEEELRSAIEDVSPVHNFHLTVKPKLA